MSLYATLKTAQTALSAGSQAISTSGQNINNLRSTAYKNAATLFTAQVTMKGNQSGTYTPGGVVAITQREITNIGAGQPSTVKTHLMSDQQGFFMVSAVNTDQANNNIKFTRSGDFRLDSSGFLVNNAGYYMLGWQTDATGTPVDDPFSLTPNQVDTQVTQSLKVVKVNRNTITSQQTTKLTLSGNLDSRKAIKPDFLLAKTGTLGVNGAFPTTSKADDYIAGETNKINLFGNLTTAAFVCDYVPAAATISFPTAATNLSKNQTLQAAGGATDANDVLIATSVNNGLDNGFNGVNGTTKDALQLRMRHITTVGAVETYQCVLESPTSDADLTFKINGVASTLASGGPNCFTLVYTSGTLTSVTGAGGSVTGGVGTVTIAHASTGKISTVNLNFGTTGQINNLTTAATATASPTITLAQVAGTTTATDANDVVVNVPIVNSSGVSETFTARLRKLADDGTDMTYSCTIEPPAASGITVQKVVTQIGSPNPANYPLLIRNDPTVLNNTTFRLAFDSTTHALTSIDNTSAINAVHSIYITHPSGPIAQAVPINFGTFGSITSATSLYASAGATPVAQTTFHVNGSPIVNDPNGVYGPSNLGGNDIVIPGTIINSLGAPEPINFRLRKIDTTTSITIGGQTVAADWFSCTIESSNPAVPLTIKKVVGNNPANYPLLARGDPQDTSSAIFKLAFSRTNGNLVDVDGQQANPYSSQIYVIPSDASGPQTLSINFGTIGAPTGATKPVPLSGIPDGLTEAGGYTLSTISTPPIDVTTSNPLFGVGLAAQTGDITQQESIINGKGGEDTIMFRLRKTASAGGINTYSCTVESPNNPAITIRKGSAKTGVILARADTADITKGVFNLQFNDSGTLISVDGTAASTQHIYIDYGAGTDAVAPLVLSVDFGALNEPGIGISNKEGNSSFRLNPDGLAQAGFSDISIGSNGVISAIYTNTSVQPVWRFPFALFDDANGLDEQAGGVYTPNAITGKMVMKNPGDPGAGKVIPGQLESSAVDLANEFTDIIAVQRYVGAAARIVSVTDEMLKIVERLGS